MLLMGNITETTWFEEQLENMEEDFPFLVNPEFDDFDWDTPIKDQPWYTPSTEIDLDRDVPTYEDWVEGHIGEPEYLGDR